MRRNILHSWICLILFGLGLFFVGACDDTTIPKIAIQVEPLCVDGFTPGSTQQFSARIFIDSVDQGINNGAVTWSVVGDGNNGSITEDGLYQTPDTVPPPSDLFTIQATSKEDPRKSGLAKIIMDGQGSCATPE